MPLRFLAVGLAALAAPASPARAATLDFDRIVLEFNGALGAYDVRRQASATFIQDASGLWSKPAGSAALRIVLRHASAQETYRGSSDVTPRPPASARPGSSGTSKGSTTSGV